ncbi:MAG TPA: prepilin-type N-terminal cleavage/methylation domain-containing protein [Dissulfurispiraceae bacterium]
MKDELKIKEEGFTLIEMLIALALLSVVLIAIYGTFFLSSKAVEGMDDSLVKLRECRTALDIIKREAEPLVFSDRNKYSAFRIEDRDLYGKQASRFAFTALSPLVPGLSLISYSVEEKDGKLSLIKKMTPSYKPDPEVKGVEMLEDIEAFTVEASDGNNSNKWVKMWNSQELKKLPVELKVTITVMLKGRKVSLYERIRPKIGSSL